MNEDRARFREDPQQEQEWLRQLNLIYSGLIGIGVVMIQPFLTAASLDLTAKISVIAFSVAIPLLAALVVVNRQEVFRGRATPSVLASTARVVAQASAFTGVVAGFWHILWIAGVGMLAFGNRPGWGRPRTARNPATPSHSPFDGERPGAAGPGPRWRSRQELRRRPGWSCRPRTAAAGGRPQAGLDPVGRILTTEDREQGDAYSVAPEIERRPDR